MDAIEFIRRDHARTHASALGGAEGGLGFQDLVIGGLDDDVLRQRPQDGMNSLAWLLWHIARTEDMGVNLVVAGRKPVLEEQGWGERLGIEQRDIGAGMSDEEVGDFTANVDLGELRAYRLAVGARTKEVFDSLQPEDLDEIVDPDRIEKAFADGAVDERASWVRGAYAGKTKAFVISHQAIAHSFMHLGEAWAVRSLLGQRLPI
jgi:hypothetical protein